MRKKLSVWLSALLLPLFAWSAPPSLTENASLTIAPDVPPAIARRKPALVKLSLTTEEKVGDLMEGIDNGTKYKFWTFNGHVPGPFIRVRVGDTVEVTLTNPK